MNTRLNYSTEFVSINVLENKIYPNIYKVDIDLVTISEDNDTQNVAFERMRFLLNEIFEGSILIDGQNSLIKTMLVANPLKVIVLPELPFDQIVGMALFQKINSVMDNHMLVHEIKISSRAGSNVGYIVDEQDDFGEFEKPTKIKPWWFRDDLQTIDTKTPLQPLSWKDLDLDWEEENNEDENLLLELIPENAKDNDDAAVVENKKKSSKKKVVTVELINVFDLEATTSFTPTILDGGLSTVDSSDPSVI